MAEATPRITAAYLETFTNQTVRLLGKVIQLRGEQATIDAGGQINIILNRVSTCSGTCSSRIRLKWMILLPLPHSTTPTLL